MEKHYRIRTKISKDQVIRTKLSQDVDFLEVLSLKIKQEDTYKLHTSNYGIIIGRVLANDAFGIPNAKVSVFIPLTETDESNSEITNIYPFTDIQSKDKNNIRYNLLPDESNDECYRVVGTFPNKRLTLDNETEIEIFEKYWKYTTVTNKSGDYMIFGVPTGNHEVHVDVDLSDIGVLSQKPRDFLYKGYNISQFDNANQFKESTNLDNLSQLLSQTSSVHVYPFWGDKDMGEIAITRCDLQVQYKFEPTCVFFGSIVSDNFSTSIGDKCNFSETVGFNRNLVAGEGTIEMIRKTVDGLIEEFQIQGNRLIDGNGVWCYQIPMNLDYVGTDEFGNIVPVDNPNKGIPTRTSVRFRISMQESSSEGVSRHRAKYLVPNIHKISDKNYDVTIEEPNKYDQCYEFGSATPDEFFRDLYWNKVYSVKNYIPRLQLGGAKNTQKYTAIRTVNSSGNLNPFPFNHARFKLYFSYRVICLLMNFVINFVCGLNRFVSSLADICFIGICPFGWVCRVLPCQSITAGLLDDEDNIEFFPCCEADKCMKCSSENPGCIKNTDVGNMKNLMQQSLAQEYDTVNLDFYNDWVNGCLYMPLWFWKKTKKKKFLFGLFTKKAINRYCNCDSNYNKLRITENCSLHTDTNYSPIDSDKSDRFHDQYPDTPKIVSHGIIKEIENKDGLKIYYYAPGVPSTNDYRDTTDETVPYTRLYSTEIILLGSLNSCDLDNLPQPFINLPSTTANIPYFSTLRDNATDNGTEQGGTSNDTGAIEVTGMDWLTNTEYNAGLLMDLSCRNVQTKPKTCINLVRMSELGVTLDTRYYDAISIDGVLKYDNERLADGLITRYELVDPETRAMFASLNHNGLQEKVKNNNTGYNTYKLIYNYSTDFDGHMNKYAIAYTANMKVKTYDNKDISYIDYRFGVTDSKGKRHFYLPSKGQMPLFNNSFYFYFGLNEGNTAIDKFNNLFYSQCFKNYKYPFTMSYSTTPAKWCKEYDNIDNPLLISDIDKVTYLYTDYATIQIDLKSISLPYSYVLLDEYNTEIMSENNIYATTLKFGYSDDGITKYGILRYTNGDIVAFDNNNNQYAYLLDNGVYKLKVVDANGASITQTISITQSQIDLDITSYGLGDKYYSGTTIESDLCNDEGNYGEIIINSIVIDGKDYKITKITKNNNTYDLTCEYTEIVTNIGEIKRTFIVLLSIEPQLDELFFDDCTCHDSKYETSLSSDGKLHISIWVPGDYKLTVNQYCNGKLNDNLSTNTVNIPNGTPFITYINETPLKFIIGNSNFYSPKINHDIYTNKSWFNLDSEYITTNTYPFKENVYDFEDVSSESSIIIWQDFVNVRFITDNNGNKIDIDSSTKLNILNYKFNCLMDMSNNHYMIDNNEKDLVFKSTGGKSPILYRGLYPEYNKFNNEDIPFNTVLYDSDASITCIPSIPNIVTATYAKYDNNNDAWISFYDKKNFLKPLYNPLFSDNTYLGNYFAAFTSNAGYENVDGTWVKNEDLKYKASPSNTDPKVNYIDPGDSIEGNFSSPEFDSVYGDTQYNAYFRTLTIDRRPDYAYFAIMPIYNSMLNLNTDNDVWQNGRLVGYQYNGVEMCYDSNHNIIGIATWDEKTNSYIYGDDYEYYLPKIYTSDDNDNIISCFSNDEKLLIYHNTNNKNKKFYSCKFKADKSYDINNCFWATNKSGYVDNTSGLMLNDYSKSTFYSVNDSFSIENYPTIRGLDIYNFKHSNRYTYSLISCNYDTSLEIYNTEGEAYKYAATIFEGEELTFSIGGNNMISVIEKDFNNASSINGDIILETKMNSTEASFYARKINMSFKINDDKTNQTHNNFIYIPYVYINSDTNIINKLSAIKDNVLLTNGLDNLVNDVLNNQFTNSMQLNRNNISLPDEIDLSNTKIENDIFGVNNSSYLAYKTDSSILFCNDSSFSNIIFNIKLDDLNLTDQVRNHILMIYYLRRYFNNIDSNLCRDLLTFNIGDLIPISLKLGFKGEIKNINGISTQYTEFYITLSQFRVDNASSILASFEYDYSKPNQNSVTCDIDKSRQVLVITVKWDGNLANTFLQEEFHYSTLCVKSQNGYTYVFNFNLNKYGIYNTQGN